MRDLIDTVLGEFLGSGSMSVVRRCKLSKFQKALQYFLRETDTACSHHSLRCVRKLDGQTFAVLHLSSWWVIASQIKLARFDTSKVTDWREDKRNRVEHFEVKCVTAIDEEVRQFSRDELLSCAESVEIQVSIVGFTSAV